ncbi:hypothetical protein [Pontibacter pamirensis]|uniref:hypothetical protein n=1 Tax=Pontibacter pamirensis TaxID=2562824 RepID=UPI001F1C066D|nr:hypothetical protein [Pontibacter pamirensis]
MARHLLGAGVHHPQQQHLMAVAVGHLVVEGHPVHLLDERPLGGRCAACPGPGAGQQQGEEKQQRAAQQPLP